MTSAERAEQAKKNIQAILSENPELKKAFRKTLDEMKKPENIEKIANEMTPVIQNIFKIKEELDYGKK